MSKYADQIKARITQDTKWRLEAEARLRQIDVSDIVREAIREHLERNGRGKTSNEEQPELMETGK